MNKQLIEFYIKQGKDHAGRTHGEILIFSPKELENTHDYIQWLFPTKTKSQFNPDAPLLDEVTIATLRASKEFNRRFSDSILKMLRFWGIGQNVSWHPWMEKGNHNLLRLTRFMESCRLLGHQSVAIQTFEVLLGTANPSYRYVGFVQPENIFYWYKAAFGKKLSSN